MDTCLIIGAGISGLLAANELQTQGFKVTVLDKGQSVGGRMATRRFDEARVDHGAQFFTVRSERFDAWVQAWLDAGVVAEWSRGFPPDTLGDGHPRYRGVWGMSAVAKHLAATLDVHAGTRVVRIESAGRQWQAVTAGEKIFTAEALILTPPVPQSLALLAAGNVSLAAEVQTALEAIQYDPCFAVMATLDGETTIPEPGGVQVDGEPITWISDNKQKGISERTAVTIHASPDFTRAHFDDNYIEVAALLLDAAHNQGWLDKSRVREIEVQRWRYSRPTHFYSERCLPAHEHPPLLFAGDAFYEARIEGAALSGLAAADRLRAL